MATLPLEIDLLGPLRVRHEGRTLTRFQTRKTAALLGLMALRPHRPHRREEIVELLWPEADEPSGQNRLRLALSDLRRHLEAPVAPAASSRRVVVADRVHVCLDTQAFTTDKSRFEALLEQAQTTSDDAQRIAWLIEAADLYRGDLLCDFDESWIMGERQQTTDAYLLALRRLIKALAKTQQYDRALLYAQRAVQADPLREETHRSLMQLYTAMGRPADALRQYREMEERLREDLNAAPSSLSQQLHAQLHVPASKNLSPFPPGIQLTSSPTSEQVTAPAVSSPAPTLERTTRAPAIPTLPVYGTSLLGRHREMAQVCEMLQTPDTRLVTITGMGGCGKTRVAVAVAQTLAPILEGRVWFVPLAALQDASLLWDAVAGALNLPDEPTVSRRQQVVNGLNGMSGLLVIDNCEHLGENASHWIAELLQAVPSLTCLATSRQRLSVSSEYEYGLAPLPTPTSTASAADLIACPSTQLFAECARRVRPSFAITPANVPPLTALCRSLDGLPLAIELAAAWTQTLTLAQIQARLVQRFTLLVSRHHDVPARHRSLSAVLEGSFETLSPVVQRFFTRLSVFRGGWTLDAAQTVCEEADALEYLTHLREASLLTANEIGEQMRYNWLETVREYACEKSAEQLSKEEHASLRQRHANFYADFAAGSSGNLRGEKAMATLDLLEREQANWRAALEWGMVHPPLGAQVANNLEGFWHIRGHIQEGSQWFAQALEADAGLPPSVRLNIMGNSGNFAYLSANYVTARTCYEACLEMATQAEDAYGLAHALDSLGSVALELDDTTQARRMLDESILKWRKLDAPRYLALALSHRAILANREDDYAFARKLYEESLKLYRSVGEQDSVALMLSNLAGMMLKENDYQAAALQLKESFMLSRQICSPRNLAFALMQMTVLAVQQCRFLQAARLLGQTARVREEAYIQFDSRTLAEVQDLENAALQGVGDTIFQERREQGRSLSLAEIWQEHL